MIHSSFSNSFKEAAVLGMSDQGEAAEDGFIQLDESFFFLYKSTLIITLFLIYE
jgi:hypothetical protein